MKTKKARTTGKRTREKRQILVPIDFSDSSVRALRHAASLVRESGGSLRIVHVVPADYGWLGFGRDAWADFDASFQRQAVRRLHLLANRIVPRNMEAILEVRIGRPAEEIVSAATKAKCDLIVMSTHGHSGLDRLLIGSVADRVARLAPCPVFLMRPGKATANLKPSRPAVLRLKHNGKDDPRAIRREE